MFFRHHHEEKEMGEGLGLRVKQTRVPVPILLCAPCMTWGESLIIPNAQIPFI